MGFLGLLFVYFVSQEVPADWADQNELGQGHNQTSLYIHYPPDPINIRTLNFYLPVEHLNLPCYVPIEIKAAYNSYSGDSSIFGEKWTFNHNLRVKEAGTKFQVIEGDGFANTYTPEKNLADAKKAVIEKLLIAQKKKDAQAGGLKNNTAYEEYKRKLAADTAFREEQERLLLTGSARLGPGKYYSFARGPTTLEMKADGSFIRSFQNGATETYDKAGHIAKTTDRNGNYLSYVYSGDNIIRINDMCGRFVSFTYKSEAGLQGLVDSIKDTIGREIKYEYYPGRRLKAFTDSQKNRTEYKYDKNGNMLSITQSAKPNETLAFEYNDKFEIVKQTGPGKETSQYKRSFIANNPNHSLTEVSKFSDGKLAGRELHEFKIKEYEMVTKFDASGKEISKETRRFSPETGYPVSILDGKGVGDLFDYDSESGNLLKRQSIPNGETMEFSYNPKCNQVTALKIGKSGKTLSNTQYKFDGICNLLEAEETYMIGTTSKRSVWIGLSYNKQGKISFLRDKINTKEVAFTYWQYGKPESITLKDACTLLVKYSPTGEIEKVDTFPHGKGNQRFKNMKKPEYQGICISEVRTALDSMLKYLRPAGLNVGL